MKCKIKNLFLWTKPKLYPPVATNLGRYIFWALKIEGQLIYVKIGISIRCPFFWVKDPVVFS